MDGEYVYILKIKKKYILKKTVTPASHNTNSNGKVEFTSLAGKMRKKKSGTTNASATRKTIQRSATCPHMFLIIRPSGFENLPHIVPSRTFSTKPKH